MISFIVAAAEDGVIGKDGTIPWHLPSEQAIFKKVTTGHPIIMGRKTHESIGRRTLPERYNVVITRQKDYKATEGCEVVHSLEEALSLPKVKNEPEIFIIGGSEIYKQALPLADRIYLTLVHANVGGDTFFKFDTSKWREVSRQEHKARAENEFDYDFIVLERKQTTR